MSSRRSPNSVMHDHDHDLATLYNNRLTKCQMVKKLEINNASGLKYVV